MRYANLSTREAWNVLRDYQASCEAAAYILAVAIDTPGYSSPWFGVVFDEGHGFFIHVFSPETHHTPSDSCLCQVFATSACEGGITISELNAMAYRNERR